MISGKKIYFISDVHLGLYPQERSFEKEKILVKWLDSIKTEVAELYLLGDIFDFWHEYKKVVPRGFVRFLGKIAELSDNGTKVHFFTGNHDVWVYDYLPAELGLTVYRNPISKEINGLKFFIGHGDGVGRGDVGYKILKAVFKNIPLQWMFARIHPNFSIWLGQQWSKRSRYAKGLIAEAYRGDDKELQVVFARNILKTEHYDYFIFGHRHTPNIISIGEKSTLINVGDWINNFSYAVLDGNKLELKSIYPEKEKDFFRRKIELKYF